MEERELKLMMKPLLDAVNSSYDNEEPHYSNKTSKVTLYMLTKACSRYGTTKVCGVHYLPLIQASII